MKKTTTKKLVSIAMLAAVSTALMFIDFPIPLMPPFLKLDISEVPVLIATFAMGIPAGIAVAFIKNALHLFVSTTMYVGELSNFLISVAMVVSAGIVYSRNKTRKNAVLALVVSTVVTIIFAALINRFFIIWAYVNMMGLTEEKIVAICNGVNKHVTSINGYIYFGVIPFNFIKSVINAVVTLLLYKRISKIIKKQ